MFQQRLQQPTERALRSRSALTLLEVLLVAVVLVIIASVAVVNSEGAFANTRLKKAAEGIRAEFARARIKAIKTGQVHIFRHVVAGNGYVTTAQVSPEDALESDLQSLAQPVSTDPSAVGISAPLKQLPEGVYFLGSDVSIDARAESRLALYPDQSGAAGAGAGGAGVGVGDGAGISWGTPVFFFPDGSTTTARIVLANDKGSAVSVELRGLTGVARIGRLQPISAITALGATP